MTEQQRFVVVGPDGQDDPDDAQGRLSERAKMVAAAQVAGGAGGGTDPGDAIGEPAKVMRIGTMIKQLLEEVRAAPLDEASRVRLKNIHASSIKELESGLTPDLRDELERLTLPFTEDSVPSDAELRIAQAQLVGWLEGVFHGLQAALVAQQLAARSQLEQMRRGALPPGMSAGDDGSGPGGHTGSGTGQYL